MVWTLSEALLWEFIQRAPNQGPGWVVFGEGRADPLSLQRGSEVRWKRWNEESCVEAQKCFLVEGIYETTCMCV